MTIRRPRLFLGVPMLLALGACAPDQSMLHPATSRPLWAEAAREEFDAVAAPERRERVALEFVRAMEWRPPAYHPLEENVIETTDAWGNVLKR